ncbi:MAG: TonB-dependent receptor [Rhizomicrobium sp.]
MCKAFPTARLASLLLLTAGAFGAEPQGPSAAALAASSDRIEEVVVTVEKRAANLQAVPISVAAITPKMAADFGALQSDQLTALVPGMQIQHMINATTAFIRGIGPNSNSIGGESSVAVYLDDLYIPQGNASIFSLNAISGIQVLKGPQGTLFGRNATGGVIQVATLDPAFAPSLDAHLGYGNYDTVSGDVYATGTLVPDVLAANVAFSVNDESAGWGRDVVTGERAFTAAAWAARVKFLFRPDDATRVLLSLDHFYTRSEVGMGFNQVPEYIAAGAPLLTTGAAFVGWYNTQDFVNDVGVIKHDLVELRLDRETGFADIVDIVGWQRMNGFAQFAQDASPQALVGTRLNQGGADWSNEFEILSPAAAPYAAWLTWIAGTYYLHDRSGYPGAELRGAALGFPISAPGKDGLVLDDAVSTDSIAGFAQATIRFAPRLELTLGVRYTHDERRFAGGVYFSPSLGGLPACTAAPIPCPVTAHSPGATRSWDMTTWRAALDHNFTDDLMAYVSVNRGAKSGQFDAFGAAFSGLAANPPVAPEFLQAYEIGLKSEWDDRRIRLNLAAFHYDASNLQFIAIVAGGTKLLNAAGAEVYGAELDAIVMVLPSLTASLGLSLQHGRYTSFPNAPADFSPPDFVTDAAGNPTVHTPSFTGSLNLDYGIAGSLGSFDVNVNYIRTASFEWAPDRSLRQPATDIFNASLLWTDPSGRHDVRLWAANITGERYYSYGSETLGFGKQFSPAAPATFGITLGMHVGQSAD